MRLLNDEELIRLTGENAHCFNSVDELEPLVERLANAQVVMLGEATHGTQEFYFWRRKITELLIEKYGFNFIAVEGDWPPCQRVNEYIQGRGEASLHEVFESFDRWPTWMWANNEISKLVQWLKEKNSSASPQVGFHGLDVYSFFDSMKSVLEQLEKVNPFLARRARIRYSCFDPYQQDERKYIRSLFEFPKGCEDEVVETLEELLKVRLNWMERDESSLFDIRQNARIVRNAENYYRTMVHGNEDSWNVRDRHMMETLEHLMDSYGSNAKGIVWEHNTHIGDYRATDMLKAGQINLGGLARKQYGHQAVALVGFGTYEGTVVASHAWEGPVEKLKVPEARAGSIEAVFHSATEKLNENQFFLIFAQELKHSVFSEVRPHRAIGVVYEPEHERWGNYVPTSLSKRYDAFIFIDKTSALEPIPVQFRRDEIPEAWPSGR